jgi:acetoin:2,6-dichlorophenolindophenol oxidoreductase subunit alpha
MTVHADADTRLDSHDALRILRMMLLIRRFEEASVELYQRNLIPGFIHPAIGEEAVHVGVCDLLQPSDHVIATHRGHGQALARGVDPAAMMAEILGRATGTQGGRGGSLHIGDWKRGVMPASPLVGGGLGTMTGVALAHQYRHDGGVAVCFFGDGALNRGSFHEAMNMAATWQLPILYACIDNGWAISVPRRSSTAGEPVDRARAYGIPGAVADGKDVIACRTAAEPAIARARDGGGPSLIFFDCPRGYGHEEGDAQEYRDPDDFEAAKRRDPLPIAYRAFAERGLMTAEDQALLEPEVDAIVRRAVDFAMSSPEPDPATAVDHVFPDVPSDRTQMPR